MNSQAIAQFVQAVTSLGPVRAKSLRNGKVERLTGASVTAGDSAVKIESAGGGIDIPLTEIETIIFSPEDRKYFVHLLSGLVELRPDED